MTEEEKAEQYVKENGKVYYHSNGEPMFTREEDLKIAFLAGLKAGRPKWHKVADGDLPLMMEDEREISNNVWIHIKNWGTEVGHYDYRKKAWIVRCMIVNLDVIAWCEIPEYSEE